MFIKRFFGCSGRQANYPPANPARNRERPHCAAVQMKRSAAYELSCKMALIIFCLALIIRVVFVFAVPPGALETDAKDYDTLGWQLAQGKGYVNAAGRPTAYRPPVYPLFLGAIYSVFGHTLTGVRLAQALIGAGICVLTYFMTAATFNSKSAQLAGFWCSLYPPLIVHTSDILTEILFTFFLVWTILLMISKSDISRLMAAGIVLGLALLTRPFAVFFLPFLLYWLYLNPKYKTHKAAAVLLTGVLLVMAPWVMRNYFKMGAFVPFANVGGLTLYNSYRIPPQGFGYNSLAGLDREFYEISDETERNQYLIRKTTKFIRNNPVQAIKLAAIKLLHFIYPFDGRWYPVGFGSKYNIFWGITMAFAAYGLLSGPGKKDINKILLVFLFLAFVTGVIVFYGSPRFRLPLEPFLISLAAGSWIQLTNNGGYIPAAIIVPNLMLFVMFHFYALPELFRYLKTWL